MLCQSFCSTISNESAKCIFKINQEIEGERNYENGDVFSCPFQGALWKLAYNTPCLSQNTEMRSGEIYVLTLRVAILRLKVFVLSQEFPNLATVSRCSELFYNMKAAKEQFDMIESF